jgi:hypothetical protein
VSEHRNPAEPHVRETARTLVEIAAGVMQTDAASLWRYEEHAAVLVARHPEGRMPSVLDFSQMPEVAQSIKAQETQLYVRSEADGTVRDWMEGADITVSLRLPVAAPEVPQHFIGLSWATDDHPAIESLLPTAQRVADQIALALTRLAAERLRVESALELSDNVAQALVIAKSSLHLDRQQDAERAIDRAIDETRRIMLRLMRDDPSASLRRLYPSDVLGASPDREPEPASPTGPDHPGLTDRRPRDGGP